MKKNVIKQQIQCWGKGRYLHLLDAMLVHNDVIAKIDEQQNNRVEGRIATGVALDKQNVYRAKDTIIDNHRVHMDKGNVLDVYDDSAKGENIEY